MWFLTLTYPGTFSPDPLVWKAHLKAFRKRLERAWGRMAIIWKLEFQRRGAPHFHLIVIVTDTMISGMTAAGQYHRQKRLVTRWIGGEIDKFRLWCSVAWSQVVAGHDGKSPWVKTCDQCLHELAGTNCEPFESWNKITAYAAKYMGKEVFTLVDENGEVSPIGRFWGCWRGDLLPISWKRESIAEKSAVMFKRTLRRWMGRKYTHLRSHPRKAFSAFVPAAMVERLHTWLSSYRSWPAAASPAGPDLSHAWWEKENRLAAVLSGMVRPMTG